MASVNFMKLTGSNAVKGILRHCDPKERERHEHKNQDIDKSQISNDIVMRDNLDYALSCGRYMQRIKDLDSTTNTNKRKDRVTCFSLEVPSPEGLDRDQANAFLADAFRIMQQRFGVENVINGYIHNDEIHNYMDHGEIKESRSHIHVLVVPEIDGKLNGKSFSSRKNMKDLNNTLDSYCRSKYKVPFMTHEKPRKRTVEELKQLSNDEINKREQRVVELEGRVLKASELKAEISDHDFFGRERDTVTIPYQEYKDLQKTARAVEDALAEQKKNKQLQDQINQQRQEIDALHRQANRDAMAEREEREKAAQMREQAQKYKDEQEAYIIGTAKNMAQKKIAELLDDKADSYTQRLKDFCSAVKYQDGTSVFDKFEAREKELADRARDWDWER